MHLSRSLHLIAFDAAQFVCSKSSSKQTIQSILLLLLLVCLKLQVLHLSADTQLVFFTVRCLSCSISYVPESKTATTQREQHFFIIQLTSAAFDQTFTVS